MLLETRHTCPKNRNHGESSVDETTFTKYSVEKPNPNKREVMTYLIGNQNFNIFPNHDEIIPLPFSNSASNAPVSLTASCVKWSNMAKHTAAKQNIKKINQLNGQKKYCSLPIVPKVVKSDILTIPKTSSRLKQFSYMEETIQPNKNLKTNAKNEVIKHKNLSLERYKNSSKPIRSNSDLVFKKLKSLCHTSCGVHDRRNIGLSSISSKLPVSNNLSENVITQATDNNNNEKKTISKPEFLMCPSKSELISLRHENSNVYLPPPVITSPLKILKPASKNSRKAFTSQSSREDTRKISHDRRLLRIPLNGNGLADRLSLIHFYGSAYENIAIEKQQEKEREIALMKQEVKRAEKLGKEMQKREQRKKIYALNRLMTKLEQEKFEQFMNTLTATEDVFI